MTGAIAFPGRLPLLTEIILVLLLGWMVVGWFLSEKAVEYGGDNIQPEATALAAPELAELLSQALFGKAKEKSATPVAAPELVQKVVMSPLNIKLLGTVVAGENSAAVLVVSNAQKVVFIGSKIQSGVLLKEVEVEAVVVERAGRLERIVMQKSQLQPSVMQPTQQRMLTPAVRSNQGRTQTMDRGQQGPSTEFMKLMSQARIVPHFNQGKSEGFLINSIVSGSLYDKAGLKNGDIIQKVNGKAVQNMQQAMGLMQSLQQATILEVEVKRGGQLQQLSYQVPPGLKERLM